MVRVATKRAAKASALDWVPDFVSPTSEAMRLVARMSAPPARVIAALPSRLAFGVTSPLAASKPRSASPGGAAFASPSIRWTRNLLFPKALSCEIVRVGAGGPGHVLRSRSRRREGGAWPGQGERAVRLPGRLSCGARQNEGRVSISQINASIAAKAGKPQRNQMR